MIFKVIHCYHLWQIEDVPGPMCSLVTVTGNGNAVQYELIDKYSDKVRNNYNAELFKRCCTEIRQIVLQIESGAILWPLGAKQLVQNFKDTEQGEINDDDWYKIRDQLMQRARRAGIRHHSPLSDRAGGD